MLFAMGDIHGEFDLLFDLYEKIMDHSKQYDEPHTVIFLGDYVDRGSQSKAVIDFLMTNPFDGFEHISVHIQDDGEQQIPSWEEMRKIKDIFWDDDDIVAQYYPSKESYIYSHENTIHLFRCSSGLLPHPVLN